jgi:SLOG in TRPM, prokaryote/SMODS and SLOG-associating 2TM effector domain 1/Protein of unknown function (DUF4231)
VTATGLDWGEPRPILFEDGKDALAWHASGADPASLRPALGREHGAPVLVIVGGAENLTGAELDRTARVLGPAVPAAAGLAGAVVVDGGTSSGVMEVIGTARARRPAALPVLIGVAPAGRVSYPGGPQGDLIPLDRNHTHFVLADSDEWGGETALLIGLAAALAHGYRPVMALAGGGSVATSEVLNAVRRGWPVFVIEGTGGLADSLLSLWTPRHPPRPGGVGRLVPSRSRPAPAPIADPDLREIIETGDLHPVTREDTSDLARRLAWELQDEPVLKSAWQEFASCDGMAKRLRKLFAGLQAAILLLGVTATLLALLYDETHSRALHWLVVVAPILASVLIALVGRYAAGQRWVLLRGAAESIKSEIFRYRTRTPPYTDAAPAVRYRALAGRVDAIKNLLMQTEVSTGELPEYAGPLPPLMYGSGDADDGLSELGPERYLSIRLNDQLGYYRGRIASLSRRRWRLQVVAIAAGGAGTLLAAAGFDIWVGLTGGIAAASLAYLGYLQVDNTIVTFNQAATRLDGLRRRWLARDPAERDAAALGELVAGTEDVLTTELAGWVQQMNDAMAELKSHETDQARQVDPEAG